MPLTTKFRQKHSKDTCMALMKRELNIDDDDDFPQRPKIHLIPLILKDMK